MGSSSVTGDLRSGVERDVIEVPVVSQDNISDWLLSLGLQRYLGLLMANGFDDVDFLVSWFSAALTQAPRAARK